jgi:hypothetical protein
MAPRLRSSVYLPLRPAAPLLRSHLVVIAVDVQRSLRTIVL